MLLYNRYIGTFSSHDVELLEEIVIKSETALENAQLYHTLEKRVQQRTRDLVHEKNNLTYKVYPGLDHGFTGPDPLDPKAGEVFQLPRVVDRFLDWYLGGRFIAPPDSGS